MTAPDPRLGEIEGRLAADWEASASGGYIGDDQCMKDRDYLLTELRKAQDALGRVEAVAGRLEARVAQNYRNMDSGLYDTELECAAIAANAIATVTAADLRAAVAAATGGGGQ